MVGSQAWVGDDGSMAARLVHIGDGSIEEERSKWRGSEERDMERRT